MDFDVLVECIECEEKYPEMCSLCDNCCPLTTYVQVKEILERKEGKND